VENQSVGVDFISVVLAAAMTDAPIATGQRMDERECARAKEDDLDEWKSVEQV
jgi:hypothetical protein